MDVKTRRETAKDDLRDRAAYGLAEAARYLKLPAPTLRSWVAGRAYPKAKGAVGQFRPLIHPPRKQPPVLSFWNLIEAHVLRSLRTGHGVSLRDMRDALAYAERTIAIDPKIAFGRPIVARMDISTGAIAGRIDASEPVQEIADDYDLTVEEVEQAALYERAA